MDQLDLPDLSEWLDLLEPQDLRAREARKETLDLRDLVVCPDLWEDLDQEVTEDPLAPWDLQE